MYFLDFLPSPLSCLAREYLSELLVASYTAMVLDEIVAESSSNRILVFAFTKREKEVKRDGRQGHMHILSSALSITWGAHSHTPHRSSKLPSST